MASIFGIPDLPMGDDATATRIVSQHSVHVIIAYPDPQDWLNLYDPQRSRDVRASRESFKSLRDHHQKSVAKLLDRIHGKASGRALLAELSAAPNEVLIYPFDFRPSVFWRRKPEDIDKDVKVIAETTSHGVVGSPPSSRDRARAGVDNELATLRAGVPICGKNAGGDVICVAAPGGGGRVAIFFESLRADETQLADECLLHELVHAARNMRGLIHQFPMTGGGYPNKEEFIANLVQNIYRSETGVRPLWYGGAPIADAKSFLDAPISPSPRGLIAMTRSEQPDFFAALARIEIAFNPVREVDGVRRAYEARTARR